jgi:large subunit ribosomal protein L4
MPSLPVYNRSGKKVGSYDIEPKDLAPRISKQLLHDAVVMYQANRRMGTHKTKTRSEVAGTTKKMYRQKGTGNARAGSRRSGIRRGGGHIHAIRPRDYSYSLPRRALQVATCMAIASKIVDDQIVIVDEIDFAEPRTKELVALLDAVGLAGLSTLVATEQHDANVYKSARNIEGVTVSPVAELNAYLVLAPRRMLVTRAALDAIKRRAAVRKRRSAETAPAVA